MIVVRCAMAFHRIFQLFHSESRLISKAACAVHLTAWAYKLYRNYMHNSNHRLDFDLKDYEDYEAYGVKEAGD